MTSYFRHVALFFIGVLCGMMNAFNSAVMIATNNGWLLFYFPAMLICGWMAYEHFWWAIFRIRFDGCFLAWTADNSPRFTALMKAKDSYEKRDLLHALHFLKQAEQEDLTHYR